MADMECPYCGADQEVCHDDGQGYEEDEKHEHECSECNKYFVFRTTVIYSYESAAADCLNTGKHNFKLTNTHPKCFSVMRCADCGEERELTEKERIHFGIETKEEYLKRIEKKHFHL